MSTCAATSRGVKTVMIPGLGHAWPTVKKALWAAAAFDEQRGLTTNVGKGQVKAKMAVRPGTTCVLV